MATLPDTNSFPQTAPQPAAGVASFEPPNWRQVGMAGQVVQGAGRDLQDAANTIAQTNDRQDALVAQAAANTLRAKTMALQYGPDGFAQVQGGGVLDPQFLQGFRQRLGDTMDAIRGALPNPNQQRMFDQHAEVNGLQFQQAILEHQSKQTQIFNDQTDDNTLKLGLQQLGQDPLDALTFNIALTGINGTIDRMAARKGLPDAWAAQQKQIYLDAATSTRIQQVLNGVPGVVQASPYLAEKMFEAAQQQLGPATQVMLAHEVLTGVKTVQQRDLPDAILSGQLTFSPDSIATATRGTPPLQAAQAVVQQMESGGNPDAVSPKGAQGAMQVMPATAANPGFGVRPAQLGPDGKPLPGELERVGRDYLGAMFARYHDPALVLAAYNAGPGQVDKWITQFGDPRAGQITSTDWASKIPFAETNKYVAAGLQKLGAPTSLAAGGQPGIPLTAAQMKAQGPALIQQTHDLWAQAYPNDPVGADGAATRMATRIALVVGQQQATQDAARDTLFSGLVGPAADGSQKPQSMEALLADPATRQAWSQASPEVQLEVQQRMRNGEPQRTAATQALVYQLQGQLTNDRESFANLDLTPYISQLPFADFDKVSQWQLAARNKQDLAADKAVNLQHALALSEDYVLKPAGIFIPDKNSPAAKRQIYDQFTGALMQELDDFKAKNGKPPQDSDVVSMARGLMTTVQVPGHLWGTSDIRAFQVTPENQGSVTVQVPPDFRTGIVSALKAKGVATPTEAQIQTAYLTSLRAAPKK